MLHIGPGQTHGLLKNGGDGSNSGEESAPKVAKGPGELRKMNGGLLQGLEVLFKGVVGVDQKTPLRKLIY